MVNKIMVATKTFKVMTSTCLLYTFLSLFVLNLKYYRLHPSIHSLCSVLLYLIQYYDIKFGIDLQSFSPGTLIFFTDKTDCHDIYIYIYRITSIMEIETYIIMSIEASPIGRTVILVVMYVKIFTTGIIVFISNISHAFDVTLTNYFQYQSVH